MIGEVKRSRRAIALGTMAFIGVALMELSGPAAAHAQAVSFTKDVAPILQEKCVQCHRPGEMAPMSLQTYQEVRPWARSMRTKVSKREMPPWFIDKTIGTQKFKNDDSLSDVQIATIVKWVDAGAPEGNPADMPAKKTFPDSAGWGIGKPDLIVTQEKPFKMYAAGSDWWETFTVNTGLTEDRWIKAVQLKPGNSKIVHHFCAFPAPPAGPNPLGAQPAVGAQDQYAEELQRAAEDERRAAGESNVGAGIPSFGCYLPGRAGVFFPDGSGILMRAGSRMSFQMHYSASGEEGVDQSSVALVFYPKGVTPKTQILGAYFQKFPAFELDIPPNSRVENDAYFPLQKPTRLLSFTPHMHRRGAALVLEAILPTGRVQTLSAVDKYNYNWQLEYIFDDDVAPLLPAGTVLHAIVVHDNTTANPRNPDANRWVGYGQSSIEEMAGAFISWVYLDDAAYRTQVGERRLKMRAAGTQQQQ
jgi:mono/diheme cytochrome c family protein